MLKIGLTGGIGTGKSTVARFFKILDVPVYEADIEAKKIINYNPLVKKAIIELLDSKAYNSDGIYDSVWVSQMVFKDQKLLSSLNSIIHPEVRKHYENWCDMNQNQAFTIKEAAIMDKNQGLDQIWVVTSPLELRIKRLLKRDKNRTQTEIMAIISKQKSESEFIEMGDKIIINDEKTLMIPQLLDMYNSLQ